MPVPFILKARTPLPSNVAPNSNQKYDTTLQLWVNTSTGAPIVTELHNDFHASQFGETTETRAPEGVDQPVTACLFASQFGETTMTKTSGEGTDQSSEVLHLSQFGETSLTESGEGVDSAESVSEATYAINSLV